MSEILGASVDLRGLLQVVGKHLYSSPEVALRELVQNAHDSAVRRSIEDSEAPPPEIRVVARPDETTLRFIDNGAGLTHDEIVTYLATIGSGKTREVRSSSGSDALIGQFGLGFLSAYSVADKVVVHSTSHTDPTTSSTFASRDGQRFTLSEGGPRDVGTEVILHLKEEHAHLARPEVVRRLLQRYCCLLPIPVCSPTPVNPRPPPWRRSDDVSPFRLKKELLDFAETFEGRFRPLAVIPIEPREGCAVRGVLWIQDGATYASSDNRNISLFVRGMLISDDLRDLIPRWAGFVGGVLECDHLHPTASREDIQRDEAFSTAVDHLRESLIRGLRNIAESEREAWSMIVLRHNEALLGASLADTRLFDVLRDTLTVPTNGDNLTLPEIRQRSGDKLVQSTGSAGSVPLWFRSLDQPLIAGHRFGVAPFVARWAEQENVELVRLGDGSEQQLLRPADLDPKAASRVERLFHYSAPQAGLRGPPSGALTTESSPDATLHQLGRKRHFESTEGATVTGFSRPETSVVMARFEPASLGAVLFEDGDARLKETLESDEASRRIAHGILSLARDFTSTIEKRPLFRLYVNLDSPLVATAIATEDADLAAYIVSLAELTSNVGGDASQALIAQQNAIQALLSRTKEDP